jgi:hypothetical protein
MYQYHNNPEYNLLSVRHFSHFEVAKSTKALVTVNRLLSENDRPSLEHIAIDFRKVVSATLYNTDRALHSLMHEKMLAVPADLGMYRLCDKENPVTPTLWERLSRTKEVIQQGGFLENDPLNLFNEQELLTHLNLPTDIKIFDDDLDWQTANFGQSLPDT